MTTVQNGFSLTPYVLNVDNLVDDNRGSQVGFESAAKTELYLVCCQSSIFYWPPNSDHYAKPRMARLLSEPFITEVGLEVGDSHLPSWVCYLLALAYIGRLR